MIQSIKITNYQSLQDVDITLGKFTVIVGASSSGKSALTRAIKAITSNTLDSDSITRGAKVAAISVKTETATITIERESNGSSFYRLAKDGSQEQIFTKLNRSVPTEITSEIGISPCSQEYASVNFAGQFDTPYLLREGSSSVARILGELTNVSTIFSAVREANRRTKAASTVANMRKKDLDKVVLQIAEYSSIGENIEKLSRAETIFESCQKLDAQASRLRTLVRQASEASQALSRISEIRELPSLAQLEKAQKNLLSFKTILRTLSKAKRDIDEYGLAIKQSQDQINTIQDTIHETLVAAGHCPTCNQTVGDN